MGGVSESSEMNYYFEHLIGCILTTFFVIDDRFRFVAAVAVTESGLRTPDSGLRSERDCDDSKALSFVT